MCPTNSEAASRDQVQLLLLGAAQAVFTAASECSHQVLAAAEVIIRQLREGNQILVCGNGGSAADANHFAAELVSSFRLGLERRSLPAISLASNPSVITAYANDFSFDRVFARQVEGIGRPGDVLFAISTSGSSASVVTAASEAKKQGLFVVSLTGKAPNVLTQESDVSIMAPGNDTQEIQTVHLAVEHALCDLIEQAFAA